MSMKIAIVGTGLIGQVGPSSLQEQVLKCGFGIPWRVPFQLLSN